MNDFTFSPDAMAEFLDWIKLKRIRKQQIKFIR